MASKTTKTKTAAKTAPEITMTGEEVAELREQGMTWAQIAEAAGLPDGATIIPLRNAMYRAVGKTVKAKTKAAIAKEVVAMRDSGAGWPKIAAATGLSQKDARAAYSEGGGKNPDGRVYVKQAAEGAEPVVTVRVEPTRPKADDGEPEPAA